MKINSIIMAMVLVIAGCGKQKEADTNTKADVKAKSKSAENLGIPFDDDDAVLKQLKKDNPTPDQSRVNVLAVPPHAHYSGTVLSAKGTPVPRASVLVYAAGTKVKGKLFQGESAGTTKFASFLDLTSAAQDVSSTGWNLSGHHAFDDKPSTRWSSAAGVLPPFSRPSSSHQWIWVDCGADVPLRSVWVDFQNSAAVDYTVRLLTEAQAKALGLKKNGKAGGGPEKWKTIATGKGLPNGWKSPNRKLSGVADKWNFVNGTAVIPDNTTGTAEVNVTNPVGRYVMVDTTRASDAGYGNVSIWKITVETEAGTTEVPIKSVVYATTTDNVIEPSVSK